MATDISPEALRKQLYTQIIHIADKKNITYNDVRYNKGILDEPTINPILLSLDQACRKNIPRETNTSDNIEIIDQIVESDPLFRKFFLDYVGQHGASGILLNKNKTFQSVIIKNSTLGLIVMSNIHPFFESLEFAYSRHSGIYKQIIHIILNSSISNEDFESFREAWFDEIKLEEIEKALCSDYLAQLNTKLRNKIIEKLEELKKEKIS